MGQRSQISATVSKSTKGKLDRFAATRGLTKNFVVEQSLLYFMEARRELSDEALVPGRLVLEDDEFDRLVDRVMSPPRPTEALKKLMRGQDG